MNDATNLAAVGIHIALVTWLVMLCSGVLGHNIGFLQVLPFVALVYIIIGVVTIRLEKRH